MTTAEQMAIAVLKGDMVAAKMLADLLMETVPDEEKRLLPFKQIKLSVPQDRIRGIAYAMPEICLMDEEQFQEQFHLWLTGEINFMPTTGISRIELYEFPELDKAAVHANALITLERERQELERRIYQLENERIRE